MKHLILSPATIETFCVALYKMRDDKGYYIFMQEKFVSDETKKPSPLGVYIDMFDLVCWFSGGVSPNFIFGATVLGKNQMHCPDAVFNELHAHEKEKSANA